MADAQLVAALQAKARQFRRTVLQMVYDAQSGHIGGSFSAAEIMTALFFHQMKYDASNPQLPGRDRFVLSKGHCSPIFYTVLAEAGFFPKEELKTFRKINSRLQGHPSRKSLPGVEISTGSLGQGLSAGHGMALAGKLDRKDYTVYVVLGDGELNEGQVWEAAQSSAHYKSDNLVAIVDNNKVAQDGVTADMKGIEPVDEKFRSFGWDVQRVDGHDMGAVLDALEKTRQRSGKPHVIVADTIKGKGVSFMEGKTAWHGKAPDEEKFRLAMEELQ